jgi:hypothetical protein
MIAGLKADAGPSIRVDTEAFWRNGYAVIPGVFSESEVGALRDDAYQALREDQASGNVAIEYGIYFLKGDLLSKPRLRRLVLDERVLALARQILGARPVYFGDSNIQIVGDLAHNPKGQGWHKDNRMADRTNPSGLDWQGRYPVIRFGVYLQDHARHCGSVAVRVGSHLRADVTSGKAVITGPGVGDVVIWNLRTTHAGHSVRCRLLPNVKLPCKLEFRLPRWLCAGQEVPRVACFLTYGIDDDHTRRYIEEFRNRDYGSEYLKCSRFGGDVWEEVRGKDLEVIRPTPQYGTPAGPGES